MNPGFYDPPGPLGRRRLRRLTGLLVLIACGGLLWALALLGGAGLLTAESGKRGGTLSSAPAPPALEQRRGSRRRLYAAP